MMTIVVTRNVPDRFRGFLGSCMLEIAAGVYASPRMTRAVRDRVWAVLENWHSELEEGSVLMTWPDRTRVGKQAFAFLGDPQKELIEKDGMYLVRRDVSEQKE